MPNPAIVQSNSAATTSSTTNSASFSTLPSSGNGVIVVIKYVVTSGGGFINSATVADNQSGNTYTQIQLHSTVSASITCAYFWCPTITAPSGTFTVTATISNGGTTWATNVEIFEASGLAGTVDVSSHADDAGSGTKTGTITNGSADAVANDLVMASIVLGNDNGATTLSTAPTTGYTNLFVTGGGTFPTASNTAYRVNTSALTDSATFNWPAGNNSYWTGVLASFKGATVSAPPSSMFLTFP